MLVTLLCVGRSAPFISLRLRDLQSIQFNISTPREQEHFARGPLVFRVLSIDRLPSVGAPYLLSRGTWISLPVSRDRTI